MLGQRFYFQSLRKTVVGFGTLFDAIQIDRQDNDSVSAKTFVVPLSYAPREHYIATLRDSVATTGVQTTLPRMSYEMTGMTYDPTRKLSTTGYNKHEALAPAVKEFYRQLNPVPYIVTFDLNIYTRTIEDSLQIIEQVVPYFTPSFNISIKEISELSISRDVSVTLDSVTPNDTWESAVEEVRVISWTLSFSVEANIYPPVTVNGIINQAIIDLKLTNDTTLENITAAVSPNTANESDTHTITTTIS